MTGWRKKLRGWFYEDVRRAEAGRHAPKMPKFVPSLVALLLVALVVVWFTFVSFARLVVGESVEYFWPRAGDVPSGQLDEIVRSTVTAVGVLAGLFAIVYAYRKQRVEEAGGRRADEEGLSRRYQDAATQLGSEHPAIRLAGVYSMARLADDWPEQRQVCVDVLCAYVRMPWDQRDGHERQVHRAIYSVIRQHLEPEVAPNWSDLQFDFTGAHLHDFRMTEAEFHREVVCVEATFSGDCDFDDAAFYGGGNFNDVTVEGWLDFSDVRVYDELKFSTGQLRGGALRISFDELAHGVEVDLTGFTVEAGQLDIRLPSQPLSVDSTLIAMHVVVAHGHVRIGVPVVRQAFGSQLPTVSAIGWEVKRGSVSIDEMLMQSGRLNWATSLIAPDAKVTFDKPRGA